MSSIFANKIMIITGAASGLGRGLAETFAERGAKVILVDLAFEKLQEVANTILQKGGQAEAHLTDVSDYEQLKTLIQGTANRHGRIDYLFNNAGRGIAGQCQDFPIEDWHKILNINLNGVMYGCEIAYKMMVKQGFGHIINTASLAALVPFPSAVPYVTSKSAVLGLSRSLRIEGQFYGVKVSAICPGFVQTGIYESAIRSVSTEQILSSVPMPIIALEEAVAAIVRGVEKNQGVIAFPFYTRLSWWVARYCYPLSAWFAALSYKKFLNP